MDCVPPSVGEKVAKIIEKMKSKRKFLDWKSPSEETKKEETKIKIPKGTPPSVATKDLKIWSKFELDCLDKHNEYRSLHGVPALKLNRLLCNMAEEWSQVRDITNVLKLVVIH